MAKHEFIVNVNGSDTKLKVIKITPEIRLESQKYYAKALNEALNNDYFIRLELDRILEGKGVIDPEAEDRKAAEIRKNIKDMEIGLRKAAYNGKILTKSDGRKLAIEIKAERAKLSNVGSSINSFYEQTAENYASNHQTQFFVYACTVLADSGERYWRSFDEFLKDAQAPNPDNKPTVYAEAVKEFLSLAYGIDKDYEKQFYENVWLIRMGYMNDKLQFVNDKGKTVDGEGRLINDEGRFINEAGEFIDVYGNVVDKDGHLVVEDGWGEKV